MTKNFIILLSISGLSLIGACYFPIGINTWNLLTSNIYIIPEESSIFSFHVTKMNEGSGEWWLYGEDDNYYYHFTGEEITPYLAVKKSSIFNCSGFASRDVNTWCSYKK